MMHVIGPVRRFAKCYDQPEGEVIVVSRQSVPVTRMAGLQRAARMAGESFGYEDARMAAETPRADWLSSRGLWWLAAVAAGAGFVFLHFS